ncbi:methyl-accepting chemotaxis protein [uncultured Sphingomonas sp.]|uniref:methyl-accepting chemotaxis protein n=1 Tax=uncultured Sphingomonas sp. TaxID=158754 RepID=UPI0025D75161|nr:methyl-accepting chemotaxis protein [uncultured Sphingomonas sp.]
MLAFLDDWPLTKKMLAAFSFLGILLIGLAINGWVSNRDLTGIARRHVEVSVAGMSNMTDVISDIKEMRIIVYSHYNALTDDERAKLQKRLDTASEELDRDIKAFAAVADPAMAADVTRLTAIKGQLDDTNRRIFDADVTNKEGGLKLIKGEGKERSHDALDQAQKILDALRKASEDANARGNASSATALVLTIGLSVLSFVALGGVWLVINRTVAQPMARLAQATKTLAEGGVADVPSLGRGDELGEIARAVEQFRIAAAERAQIDARAAAEQAMVTNTVRESLVRVAAGDLTANVTADFPPAYAELKSNLNEALVALRELIGSVMESTQNIRTGSSEIAQASEDLARRTEANASALEQTAAAITQMDQRLKATATAANGTVQRADQTITVVSSGRSTADEAMQAMNRVSESAKGIDSVIEGLDKIAFQTRVLAMNAAVEAGRAGEAGRGFAVVADLVSALAMRAEEEAGRARDQLTATQADIVTAVGMVEKVDGALSNISSDVGEVHQLLGRIATDNQAQSSAISEISQTIGTMDQSTQQNAAMVEQTSAAARNLTSEVAAMADRAQQFNIGSGGGGGSVRKPARMPHAAASSGGYVSPVKPMAAAVPVSAGGDDWASF